MWSAFTAAPSHLFTTALWVIRSRSCPPLAITQCAPAAKPNTSMVSDSSKLQPSRRRPASTNRRSGGEIRRMRRVHARTVHRAGPGPRRALLFGFQRGLQQGGRLLHYPHQQLVDVVLQLSDVAVPAAQLGLPLQQHVDQLVVGQVVILGRLVR
ncbi:hypothetical protein GDO78_023164 [Eleutherodactylus coqui]|uniref:Uncharacterized protein n=1 Tax=Eleutherodactylus coqui TaxID=57060 RepID=A0A8J6B438_ELECQ|nr:hypothetical protein GDO78_023164 [Eleutherodactylus coqui]